MVVSVLNMHLLISLHCWPARTKNKAANSKSPEGRLLLDTAESASTSEVVICLHPSTVNVAPVVVVDVIVVTVLVIVVSVLVMVEAVVVEVGVSVFVVVAVVVVLVIGVKLVVRVV